RWLSLQIRPYKNLENRIDGAVLALFDVDPLRRHADEFRDMCWGSVASVHQPVAILDPGLRVTMGNEAFEREFGIPKCEITGQFLSDFAPGRWSAASLRRLLEEELPKQDHVSDFVLERGVSADGTSELLVNARRVMADDTRTACIVVSLRSPDGGTGAR